MAAALTVRIQGDRIGAIRSHLLCIYKPCCCVLKSWNWQGREDEERRGEEVAEGGEAGSRPGLHAGGDTDLLVSHTLRLLIRDSCDSDRVVVG